MKEKTILLVEDDYLDVTSVKRALNKLKVPYDLHVAHNGVDALAILNGNSSLGAKVLPDIILLDLNMPKMSGLEFMGIIKNYYSLKNIKIFVMTTSAEEYDIVATQQLGAAGYILKPLDFDTKKEDKHAQSVSELKKELLGKTQKNFLPLTLAGGSGFAAVRTKLLAIKKLGLPLVQQLAGAKVVAVSLVTMGALGFVAKQGFSPKAASVKKMVPLKTIHRIDTMRLVKEETVVQQQVIPARAVRQKKLPEKKLQPQQAEPEATERPVMVVQRSYKIAVKEAGGDEAGQVTEPCIER